MQSMIEREKAKAQEPLEVARVREPVVPATATTAPRAPPESKDSSKDTPSYRINLSKPSGTKWGLDIKKDKETDTILVQTLKDGPFKVWNANNPDRTLVDGCRIFEINGKTTSVQMFEEFKLTELDLVVVRPRAT